MFNTWLWLEFLSVVNLAYVDAEKIGKDSVTGDLLAVTLLGWGFFDPKSLSSSPPPAPPLSSDSHPSLPVWSF